MENLEKKSEGSWITSILPFNSKTEYQLKDCTVYVFWAFTGNKFLSLEEEIADKDSNQIKTYLGICHEPIKKGEKVLLWYNQNGQPGIIKACEKTLEIAFYSFYTNNLMKRL